MNLKRALWLVILITGIQVVYGNDSIKQLQNDLVAVADADRSTLLNKIAVEYYYQNKDSAISYANKAVANALKYDNVAEELKGRMILALSHYLKGETDTHNKNLNYADSIYQHTPSQHKNMFYHFYRGVIHLYKTELDSSLYFLSKTLELSEELDDETFRLRSLTNIGSIYWNKGFLDKALEYYTNSYRMADSIGDKKVVLYAVFNMGNICLNQQEFDKAISYFEKSERLANESSNVGILASVQNNLSIIYFQRDEYQEALEASKKAYASYQQLGNNKLALTAHVNVGRAYNYLGIMDSAKVYAEAAEKRVFEGGESKKMINNLSFLVSYYLKRKDYNRALIKAERALDIADKGDLVNYKTDMLGMLAEIHEAQENFKEAYNYQQQYTVLQDSLMNIEKQLKIEEMRSSYELGEKEKENELLRVEKENAELKLREEAYISRFHLLLTIIAIIALIIITILWQKHKRNNERIMEINNELERINAAKNRFFSIIAHDLKSPFNAIMGFSDLIQEELKEKEVKTENIAEFNDAIILASGQLYNLLENILHWANTQREQIMFNPEKIELNDIVQENIDLFKMNAVSKDIEVTSVIHEGTKVIADFNMINTVIRNLLGNAVKFTNKGGKVNIKAEQCGQNVCVSVSDTGIGLKEDMLERLFSLDTNFSLPGTDNETGTGLGLVLCKDMIDRHGGSIHVESTPDVGSTFSFQIKGTVEEL
ncbi:tetratricopeptide repeat protein [Puteibacter caeruleilacunae]|nr:tetratricopeptide repeat protein [Puteibacter caeruleilacunae]